MKNRFHALERASTRNVTSQSHKKEEDTTSISNPATQLQLTGSTQVNMNQKENFEKMNKNEEGFDTPVKGGEQRDISDKTQKNNEMNGRSVFQSMTESLLMLSDVSASIPFVSINSSSSCSSVHPSATTIATTCSDLSFCATNVVTPRNILDAQGGIPLKKRKLHRQNHQTQ